MTDFQKIKETLAFTLRHPALCAFMDEFPLRPIAGAFRYKGKDRTFNKVVQQLLLGNFTVELNALNEFMRIIDSLQLINQDKNEKLLDALYWLFEQINADNGYKKQLMKSIHQFAQENGLPCKIANMRKHATWSANYTHEPLADETRAAQANELKKLYRDPVAAEANFRKTFNRDLEIPYNEDFVSDYAVAWNYNDLAVKKNLQKVRSIRAFDATLVACMRFLNAQKINLNQHFEDLMQIQDTAERNHEIFTTLEGLKSQISNEKRDEFQKLITAFAKKNKAYQGRAYELKNLATEPAQPESMAADAPTVSVYDQRIKQKNRKFKKRLRTAALILTLLVCVGEALVPFGLSGSIIIAIAAALVNYPLVKSAMNSTFLDLFTGNLEKDANGINVSNKLKWAMRATVTLCTMAAVAYGVLGFKWTGLSLATITGIGVTSALPMIGAVVIGIAALVGMAALFYVGFAKGTREGWFKKAKNYFYTDNKEFAKQKQWGNLVKNICKNSLAAILTLAALAVTFIYFTGQISALLMNPVQGVAFLSSGAALGAGLGVSALAAVPNLAFIASNMATTASAIVDGVCALGKAIGILLTDPARAYTWIAKKGVEFKENPYRTIRQAFAVVKTAFVGVGAVTMNSYAQSLGPANDSLVKGSLVNGAMTKTGLSPTASMQVVQGTFFTYSAAPLGFAVKEQNQLPADNARNSEPRENFQRGAGRDENFQPHQRRNVYGRLFQPAAVRPGENVDVDLSTGFYNVANIQ